MLFCSKCYNLILLSAAEKSKENMFCLSPKLCQTTVSCDWKTLWWNVSMLNFYPGKKHDERHWRKTNKEYHNRWRNFKNHMNFKMTAVLFTSSTNLSTFTQNKIHPINSFRFTNKRCWYSETFEGTFWKIVIFYRWLVHKDVCYVIRTLHMTYTITMYFMYVNEG